MPAEGLNDSTLARRVFLCKPEAIAEVHEHSFDLRRPRAEVAHDVIPMSLQDGRYRGRRRAGRRLHQRDLHPGKGLREAPWEVRAPEYYYGSTMPPSAARCSFGRRARASVQLHEVGAKIPIQVWLMDYVLIKCVHLWVQLHADSSLR